jgi:hypothetical protein
MAVDHFAHFAIVTIPMLLVLWADRKNARTYASLGAFTVLLSAVWEPLGVLFGLWHYNAHPQLFGVSVLTLLNYFHWMVFSYFIGNMAARRWKG